MAFIINQGFSLKSPQYNFERDYFATVAELKAASEDWFPDNFITNVGGTLYQLKKSNSVDTNTGKWRVLQVTPNAGSATNKALGFYKFSTDGTSRVSGVTAVTKADITALGIPSADTHYTTHLVVGASDTATANAAATNGNVWLNLLDNTTLREKHNIVGTGRATVVSDANGKITINAAGYSNATSSADGLMPKGDKAKVDAIDVDTASVNNFLNGVIVKEDGNGCKTSLGADYITQGYNNSDGSTANTFEVGDNYLKVSELSYAALSNKYSVKSITTITGSQVTSAIVQATTGMIAPKIQKASGGAANELYATNGSTMTLERIDETEITKLFG